MLTAFGIAMVFSAGQTDVQSTFIANAWRRQLEHNESVWFYSLDQDPDPYFNPTRVDRQGRLLVSKTLDGMGDSGRHWLCIYVFFTKMGLHFL